MAELLVPVIRNKHHRPTMQRIGILLGSTRPSGNGKGLEKWLLQRLSHYGINATNGYELVHVYPHAPMHPLGPVEEDAIPAMLNPDQESCYASSRVNEWSNLIKSCTAFVVLTPQHNWGYPGDLKNAIDHLYHEWKGKPVMIVTYGGHGGEKCGQQLRQVFSGLRMKLLDENVEISLPSEYIRSSTRVSPDDATDQSSVDSHPSFLQVVDDKIAAAARQLIEWTGAH